MILIASITLVFLGSPLFVAIGVGTVASWLLVREGSTESVVHDMFEATKKQELLAIPFFVLAGNLMTHGSNQPAAHRLRQGAALPRARRPRRRARCSPAPCSRPSAASSPVTVIAIGSLLFPMLIKDGYDEKYSDGRAHHRRWPWASSSPRPSR